MNQAAQVRQVLFVLRETHASCDVASIGSDRGRVPGGVSVSRIERCNQGGCE